MYLSQAKNRKKYFAIILEVVCIVTKIYAHASWYKGRDDVGTVTA